MGGVKNPILIKLFFIKEMNLWKRCQLFSTDVKVADFVFLPAPRKSSNSTRKRETQRVISLLTAQTRKLAFHALCVLQCAPTALS